MSGDDATGGAGILYFDTNATTSRLATISLNRGGHPVFAASKPADAVALCKKHGPNGDGQISLLLLDTTADAKGTARLLAELISLPGSDELACMLMVNRREPNPIPGTEALPKLRRPFTRMMLLDGVARALGETKKAPKSAPITATDPVRALKALVSKRFPEAEPTSSDLRDFLEDLKTLTLADDQPRATPGLEANLAVTRADALLQLVVGSGAGGVLTLSRDSERVLLHVADRSVQHADYTGPDQFDLPSYLEDAGIAAAAVAELAEATSPIPLGKRLVENGHATREAVAAAQAARNHAIACHVLRWDQGQASFRESASLPAIVEYLAEVGGFEADIPALLLQGLRDAEEAAMMGPQMPQLDDVFIRNDRRVASIGQEAFTDDELMVLELINGRNTVKEIARKTQAGSFAVASAIFRMGRAGVVRRATPAAVSRG
jgi:hypothetical protein